jgi:uncharacterized protein YyaL (SSP411 family)
MLDLESLFPVIDRLDAYARANHWTGYDPYDLKAHPLYLRLTGWPLTNPPAKVMVNLFPLLLRRLLRVRPTPHAKAIALFANAYLTLLELTGDQSYQILARGRLEWLREHSSEGYPGLAWGMPFDFQGRDFMAAGTPSVVITSIAARAFLRAFHVLGEPQYLEAATAVCCFLASEVPRYEPDATRVCFSKMTGAHWHIHNANLMVAATLATVGRAAGADEWHALARRAANYSLAEQRPDGAWNYWGPPDRTVGWVDHYHTGFILRALDDLIQATGWEDLGEALDRGYAFYAHHLFDDGSVPRLTAARRYPVDIHSCAEAILCLSQLTERYDDALQRALAVAEWTVKHMRDPQGFFYYRRYRWLTIKIPYMRWGQAWIMAALVNLQRVLVGTERPSREVQAP